MNTQEKILKMKEWEQKLAAYHCAMAIMDFDKMTIAPSAGSSYRNRASALLSGVMFDLQTDPGMISVLKELKDDPEADGDTRRAASVYYKSITNIVNVPKDDFMEYQLLLNDSYDLWYKAKNENDYDSYAGTLKKVIELSAKMVRYRDDDRPIYDQMLEDYQPGTSQQFYDRFFEQVKERVVPLINKVKAAKQKDLSILGVYCSKEDQKKFMDYLLKYLGYTADWGYMGETEHPFTMPVCIGDNRTTTKYLDHNVTSAIFSTIHEVGHAYYGHQVDPKYEGSILGEGMASAIHESQSRFCENYLGRSHAFWEAVYPEFRKTFDAFKDISLDTFLEAVNASECTLVRTEADELTYPIHILIRYELEKGLFNGTITTDKLDQKWNDMYEKYLGVKADQVSEGILQDVHWAQGSFGYFPTYALGSAYAAQFYHQMKKDLDVDQCLREGRYDLLMEWLKEHVHKYGHRYDAAEVVEMATGEPFDPEYYFDYLEKKYTALYNL